MNGVFEDADKAVELSCGENGEVICDVLDSNFPY